MYQCRKSLKYQTFGIDPAGSRGHDGPGRHASRVCPNKSSRGPRFSMIIANTVPRFAKQKVFGVLTHYFPAAYTSASRALVIAGGGKAEGKWELEPCGCVHSVGTSAGLNATARPLLTRVRMPSGVCKPSSVPTKPDVGRRSGRSSSASVAARHCGW